jgi:hypothetical protein
LKLLKQSKKINSTSIISILPTIIFLFFILLNFNRLYSSPYTLEWNFIELSNYFSGKNLFFDIEKYKIWQANTTFYSLFISIFQFIPGDNFIFYARCLNLLVLYICIIKIFKNLNLNLFIPAAIILILIIFNPVYNIYFFRIYPDILSVCFFYLSLISFWEKKKLNTYLFFTISLLIKPVVIFFVIIFFINSNKINRILYENLVQVIQVVFFSLLIYSLYIFFFEKTIFSNNVGSSYLNFDLYNSLNNFFRYFIYSFLLLGPLSIIFFLKVLNLKKNFYIIILSLIITVIIFSYFKISSDYGELEYGFLTSILGTKINILNIIMLFMCIFLISFNIKNFNQYSFIFFMFLLSLIILSFFIYRPAQRYILYAYPLFVTYTYFFLINSKKSKLNLLFLLSTFFFYLIINFSQFYIQKQKTLIIDDLVQEIKDKNYINYTYPGIVAGSHGFHFDDFIKRVKNTEDNIGYKYAILSQDCTERSLIVKQFKIFFYSYSVCLKLN